LARITKKAHLFTNSNILINNLHPTKKLPITNRSVKSLVSDVIRGERCILNDLTVNFVNDIQIRRLNKKYLKHDFFTDIITFPYNSNPKNIEGEVFISLDTVKKNAEIYSTGYKMELKRVIIHGCLHLAGYNDKTNKEKELIRTKENFYLRN